MDWLKKHVDTVIVLGGLLSSVIWMNTKFGDLDTKINTVNTDLTAKINTVNTELTAIINAIDKEVSIMKTVLIMQRILPKELAHAEKEEKE